MTDMDARKALEAWRDMCAASPHLPLELGVKHKEGLRKTLDLALSSLPPQGEAVDWEATANVLSSIMGEKMSVEDTKEISGAFRFVSPPPAPGMAEVVAALEFYANEKNYTTSWTRTGPVDNDFGAKAKAALAALRSTPNAGGEMSAPAGQVSFQDRVQPWMMACFGPEISADRLERNDRFIEEALELVQAGDYPKERAHALVDYVYGRPQGEINQEAGGVMVTLAAHCLAHGVDMHEAGETELARINQPEIIEKIRKKQAAKPKGSALPIATPDPSPANPRPDTKGGA